MNRLARHPTIQLAKRYISGNKLAGNGIKNAIKAVLGALVFKSGFYRRYMQGKAVVVAFHRVNQLETIKPLVCTTGDFREYCAFFKEYFAVVRLTDLVKAIADNRELTGKLAITFDDGYWDNAAVAAVELKKYGLPATFFVTTDFIGTDTVSWWDKKAGVRSQWMGWDDVRRLVHDGFEIGPHTMTHPDLSKLSTADASREIAGSMERLSAELGSSPELFAYPYGGKEQITDDQRELVRQLGFKCCASSYGGLVASGTDPFSLRRSAVDSTMYRSPYEFAFDLWRQMRSA